jgi:ABC-type antimicrobial peptide transport system permease subunit
MVLTVKLQGGAPAPVTAIRAILKDISPDVPLDRAALMQERLAESTNEARFLTLLITAFGVLALLLAAVGTYATASYVAGRRMREVGIRLALGARPASIIRNVLFDNTVAAGAGLAAGLVLTLLLSRFLQAYVFGVTARDPATVALACAVIGGSALLAALVPALRAARVDPNQVLRVE